jgi:hypothetical protein
VYVFIESIDDVSLQENENMLNYEILLSMIIAYVDDDTNTKRKRQLTNIFRS